MSVTAPHALAEDNAEVDPIEATNQTLRGIYHGVSYQQEQNINLLPPRMLAFVLIDE